MSEDYGNIFRVFGANFFASTLNGRRISPSDPPIILGDARYLNVWFPADWTHEQAEEWRRLHGMGRGQEEEEDRIVRPKPGLIV